MVLGLVEGNDGFIQRWKGVLFTLIIYFCMVQFDSFNLALARNMVNWVL